MCDSNCPLMYEERFIPVLYISEVDYTDDAIKLNNSSNYGISSSLFTQDLEQVFRWTGPNGADSGIVNVNVGTSGQKLVALLAVKKIRVAVENLVLMHGSSMYGEPHQPLIMEKVAH